MNKIFKLFLLANIFCISIASIGAAEMQFKVRAIPQQRSAKSGMMFLVKASVENSGGAPLELWCHNCSYEKHWTVDTPGIFIQPWTCDDDTVEKIVLDSGLVYEKNIILYIPKTDASGPVTFRIGFKRMLKDGTEVDPVWSDPMTMEILVPEGAAEKTGAKGTLTGTASNEAPAVEISESMPDEIPEDEDSSKEENDAQGIDPQILQKIP